VSVEETPEPVIHFGDRRGDKVYRRRPGAYAIIFDGPGVVAAVRSGDALALPGGGIDHGETMAMALVREVYEETGLRVTWHGYLVTATQLHTVRGPGSLEKICHYHLARAQPEPQPDREADHELLWLPTERAMSALANQADRWAVELAVRVVREAGGG